MTKVPTKNGSRFTAGNFLIYFAAVLLIGSAGAKVAQIPPVVDSFRVLGYEGSRLASIALLEAVCAVLFMIRRTRSLGLLLVSAYLGGAIAVHVAHAQWGAIRPAIFLAVIWSGAWLRHPQILWSFSDAFFGVREVSEAPRRDLVSREA